VCQCAKDASDNLVTTDDKRLPLTSSLIVNIARYQRGDVTADDVTVVTSNAQLRLHTNVTTITY